MYTVVTSLSNILLKCAKTREPKDECCVSWCTYVGDNIHDPIPLDNLKNHTALLYMTKARMLINFPNIKRQEKHYIWNRRSHDKHPFDLFTLF